jgi:hypothetical protein
VEEFVTTLKSRLVKERGLSIASAEWAVRTWLEALGHSDFQSDGSRQDETFQSARPAKIRAPLVVLFVVIAAVIVGIVLFNVRAEPSYNFERIVFFQSDNRSDTDAWEARNENAWCEPGAAFPSDKCYSLVPFNVSTPFIHARVGVEFTGSRHGEVDVACTLANETGQIVSTAESKGAIPDPRYPRLMRTGWVVVFTRPASGWTPGRYQGTCTTQKGSIHGWLDIKG